MDVSFVKDMKLSIKHICEENNYCETCPFENNDQCVALMFFDGESDAPCDWAVY